MSLFRAPLSYLGIDFDTRSIKVVELRNEAGRPRLMTYGYLDRQIDKIGDLSVENVSEVASLIRQVCKKARTSSTKVISALPTFSVFTSILTLPVMARKDMGSAVKWEAKKVVPLPIDDMILDWKLLDEGSGTDAATADQPAGAQASSLVIGQRGFMKIAQPKKGKYVRVLLTAAPKDLVRRYVDVFKAAGLSLLSIDTESFAHIRALVGGDPAPVMVLDLGSTVTTITIVLAGVPVFTRSLDVGGSNITTAIAQALQLSLEQAEQFKYDRGVRGGPSASNVPKVITQTIAPIVDELRYSLNIFQSQGEKPIEKIILTGGSSLLLGLPEHLANTLSVKVFLGDPWARVIFPQELKPVLDEVGPRFSVAIGLAMRNIE